MKDHITVCICTFKRPSFLERVLEQLNRQITDGQFTYSIVVADNDSQESARTVVSRFASSANVPIKYCVERRQNIPLARNQAVRNATGQYIAFLDDDEVPIERWLLFLYRACIHYDADGVLGSAKPLYEGEPPNWIVKGRFYERAVHATGFVIDWRQGRTGNVLLKQGMFSYDKEPFRPEFLTGEDQDFFRRMIGRGHSFVWCDEALTHEIIPPIRLRGKISISHPTSLIFEMTKSIFAVALYTMLLPLFLLLGQDAFMRYLVKIFDHLGKLLMSIGIDPIKEKYVTD
jgi:glycosyltransferase involved in cell wall biosynthesis